MKSKRITKDIKFHSIPLLAYCFVPLLALVQEVSYDYSRAYRYKRYEPEVPLLTAPLDFILYIHSELLRFTASEKVFTISVSWTKESVARYSSAKKINSVKQIL